MKCAFPFLLTLRVPQSVPHSSCMTWIRFALIFNCFCAYIAEKYMKDLMPFTQGRDELDLAFVELEILQLIPRSLPTRILIGKD